MISAPVNVSMSGSATRAWVEVDLGAVAENARTVARIAGTRLLPIVKADAYGIGAVAVSTALEPLEPWGYGVATPEEGGELRDAGIARPILVLMPPRPEQFDSLCAARLTPALGDADALRAWVARSGAGGGPFHLEIDTGMGRTGVRWDAVDPINDLVDTPQFEGCFTHLHSAERDDGSAERQVERFCAALDRLPRRPRMLHVANSAAALRDHRLAFDAVRPGLFLYGGSPGGDLPAGKHVVSLRARVVSVRRVLTGETVSYNASWTAPRDTVVATLSIGYADGVRRSLGGGGRAAVLVRGRRCPIIGQVTMDLTMVDAGDAPLAVGDIATLLGEAEGDRITLNELAAWMGELPHAVLTGLGPRLPRVYH